jgi:UDP-N-acetylglucosamine 2-epimerase
MTKLKIVTVVGTRPEIIRLSALIPKLDNLVEHTLVHTGQNYDEQLNQVFFRELGIRGPDFYLGVDTASLASVMGQVLVGVEKILLEKRPDAVVILGDTNSSIAAIIAERMQIPVYHLEAGNRSFDNNVPEELNRRIVDHVASFNLAYNEFSYRNLLAEGLEPRRLFISGSPLLEVLEANEQAISKSKILDQLRLSKDSYFLVSIHRQENIDSLENLGQILKCLETLETNFDLPILLSTHPRTRARLNAHNISELRRVMLHEPFGYFDYMNLQKNAFCVISDSGTISEDSSMLKFPAVTIRESMERPEALESGDIVISGLEPDHLVRCINLVRTLPRTDEMARGYDQRNFSENVIRFIFSTVGVHKKWLGLDPLDA